MSSRRITSTANPRVKSATRLRRRRERDRSGLLLIEGRLELEMALEAGVKLVDLLVWSEGCEDVDAEIAARAAHSAEARCEVSRSVAERLSYGEKISPIVAVARRPAPMAAKIEAADALVLVLDRIEKPGNLGAALRSADAVGTTAVLVSDPATDLFNPNVIRASRGTVFTLPLHQVSREAAAEVLADLPIVVATPDAVLDYRRAAPRPPIAIVVGSEHEGVSAFWRQRAHMEVRIPMRGRADSLNLSVSAALLLFEATRERKGR